MSHCGYLPMPIWYTSRNPSFYFFVMPTNTMNIPPLQLTINFISAHCDKGSCHQVQQWRINYVLNSFGALLHRQIMYSVLDFGYTDNHFQFDQIIVEFYSIRFADSKHEAPWMNVSHSDVLWLNDCVQQCALRDFVSLWWKSFCMVLPLDCTIWLKTYATFEQK